MLRRHTNTTTTTTTTIERARANVWDFWVNMREEPNKEKVSSGPRHVGLVRRAVDETVLLLVGTSQIIHIILDEASE
jgi:hypothetical protein